MKNLLQEVVSKIVFNRKKNCGLIILDTEIRYDISNENQIKLMKKIRKYMIKQQTINIPFIYINKSYFKKKIIIRFVR